MTAVEWLIQELITRDRFVPDFLEQQAKEMERLQLIDAQSYAISNADMTNNRGYFDCDKWYNETYGSKGSDDIKGIGSKDINGNEMIFDQQLFNYFSQEFNINLLGTEIQDIIDIVKKYTTSSQTEISDEEIEKASKYWNETTNPDMWTYKLSWKAGAKWYREQLKKKQ